MTLLRAWQLEDEIMDMYDFLQLTKRFADEQLRPYAHQFDQSQQLPNRVFQGLADQGCLGVTIPKAFGGLGFDILTLGYATELIGRACCSTRALMTVHLSLVAETILALGTATQKDYWLPLLAQGKMLAAFALSEPSAGSDAKNIQTHYRKEKDAFVISGRKKWITFGMRADVLLVFARCQDTYSAFLMETDREGIHRQELRDLLANRATNIAEITFDNVRVPFDHIVTTEGAGFYLVANTALDFGRYSVAWAGVSIIHEALSAMVSFTRTRQQFQQKLCQFQMVQEKIARAKVNYEAALALCKNAAALRMNKDPGAAMATNIAKLFSSTAAAEASNDALQLHGAYGFSADSVAQRLFREAKVLEIIEGSTQIQQQMIAEAALSEHYMPCYRYHTAAQRRECELATEV